MVTVFIITFLLSVLCNILSAEGFKQPYLAVIRMTLLLSIVVMCISFFYALQQFGNFGFLSTVAILIAVVLAWVFFHILVSLVWAILISIIAWVFGLEVDETNIYKLKKKKEKRHQDSEEF